MRVWKALNDLQILQQCLPGCERLERLGDGKFASVLTTPFGPLHARIDGRITRIAADANGMTQLSYHARIRLDGHAAALPAPLFDQIARDAVNQFFFHLSETLTNMADAAQRAAEQTRARISDARLSPLFGVAASLGALVVLYVLIHAT
jgi:carbon monoxide dehydrogenase subunit G